MDDPLIGATFADRYVIESCAGEGAMGRVYRARHVRVSRRFAVKVLFGDHAADKKMQERFAREAEAASRLDHPNVVPVLDFGEAAGGVLYLVMDYVDGPSLSEIIEREGALAPDRVRHLLRQLASGLAHAHDRHLVHRDFKADNVLVTGGVDEEIPRIADFGIAVLFEGHGGPSRLTTDGMVLGTPAYMAPEQATQEPIDHRTDLFSLGVSVYEMLAGVLPFDGTPIEVARQNLSSAPPPIEERAPEAPGDPELERVAMVLMAKDPAERFQSARDLLAALSPQPAAPAATAAAPPGPARDEAAAVGHGETLRAAAVSRGARGRKLGMSAAGALLVSAAAGAYLLGADEGQGAAAPEPPPVADAAAPEGARVQAPAPPALGDAATPAARAAAERTEDAGRAAAEEPSEPREARRREGDDRRRAADAREARSARGAGDAQGARGGEITSEALTYRYRAVGAALQGLGDSPGAERLREAYLSLSFAAALRDPARREEVYRELRRLRAELRRLDAQPAR